MPPIKFEKQGKNSPLSPSFSIEFKMEALYAKLHDKYEKLKTRKITEIEDSFKDQEEKFLNYISISDQVIEGLRSENDSLSDEMRSIRSSCEEYQRLLTVEREKTKELSNEVERLQTMRKMEELQIVVAEEENIDNTRLRKKNHGNRDLNFSGGTCVGSDDTSTEVIQSNLQNDYQADLADNHNTNETVTVLLTLMESLVGVKFTVVKEEEILYLSAVHQASGYSFRLSLVNKEVAKTEVRYEVLSLGTIEGVAEEFMTDEIIFGLDMFPLFVKKVSKALGVQY